MVAGEGDAPREDEDDGGAYGGGDVGVDIADADFGEDGRECGEERGEECVVFPHDELMFCRGGKDRGILGSGEVRLR